MWRHQAEESCVVPLLTTSRTTTTSDIQNSDDFIFQEAELSPSPIMRTPKGSFSDNENSDKQNDHTEPPIPRTLTSSCSDNDNSNKQKYHKLRHPQLRRLPALTSKTPAISENENSEAFSCSNNENSDVFMLRQ